MANPFVTEAMRELLRGQGSFQVHELIERSGLTRQALHRHLVRAIDEGWLVREGGGRGARYRAAAEEAELDRAYEPDARAEGRARDDLVRWLDSRSIERTPAANAILDYVVVELVNNAVDHSGADSVRLEASVASGLLRVAVVDDGIGAFERVRSHFGLDDPLHALQELSKGRVTTRPEQHTGEGLFFASKMVRRFRLTANGLTWHVDNERDDQTVEPAGSRPGTRAELELALDTRVRTTDVFARYTHDFEFDTTRCVVRLFDLAETFVSRSEAKRLTANLDRFREVILDFKGVEAVGQGFVDEVFRVWAHAHPGVRLVPIAMSPEVEFMVRRGLARAREDRLG